MGREPTRSLYLELAHDLLNLLVWYGFSPSHRTHVGPMLSLLFLVERKWEPCWALDTGCSPLILRPILSFLEPALGPILQPCCQILGQIHVFHPFHRDVQAYRELDIVSHGRIVGRVIPRYAEVSVVKRPPLLAMLSCDGLFGLWKPEMGEQRSRVGPAFPATIGTSGFPVAAGALASSASSDGSHL